MRGGCRGADCSSPPMLGEVAPVPCPCPLLSPCACPALSMPCLACPCPCLVMICDALGMIGHRPDPACPSRTGAMGLLAVCHQILSSTWDILSGSLLGSCPLFSWRCRVAGSCAVGSVAFWLGPALTWDFWQWRSGVSRVCARCAVNLLCDSFPSPTWVFRIAPLSGFLLVPNGRCLVLVLAVELPRSRRWLVLIRRKSLPLGFFRQCHCLARFALGPWRGFYAHDFGWFWWFWVVSACSGRFGVAGSVPGFGLIGRWRGLCARCPVLSLLVLGWLLGSLALASVACACVHARLASSRSPCCEAWRGRQRQGVYLLCGGGLPDWWAARWPISGFAPQWRG